MVTTRRAFVLSDLHLGPGGALTTFHEPERLAAVIESWRDLGPLELVLAGDVFDFLQVDGYAGFSASEAAARFDTITRHRDTARVLDALRLLAASAGVEVTVLAGNHDPELLVDEVRDAFARRIGRSPGSIRWDDEDDPLVPADAAHPAVYGRALALDGDPDPGRAAWVVHGDRWDPSNHIDRAAFRRAIKVGAAVELPVGSHLVFEVLSKLKRDHRWVDELKPELTVVLPLLLAIDPLLTMKYLRQHHGVGTSLIASRVRAALREGPLFDTGTPAGTRAAAALAGPDAPVDPVEVLVSSLRQAFDELPASQRDVDAALSDFEVFADRGPRVSTGNLLAGPTGAKGWLLRAWLRIVRATDRSGRLDGDDSTATDAQDRLPPTLGAFIAGHTHRARERPDLTPRYYNSGTWVPARSVPPGDLRIWLDEVTDSDAPRHPSPGTFVGIEFGDGPPVVNVDEWPPKSAS